MDRFALEAPGCVILYVGSVYRHDSTRKQSPNDRKTIISLMQYIQVYTMPFWYIAVYAGTSRYEILIPGYTGIYLDVRNRMVLSRWWGFQMVIPDIGVNVQTVFRYRVLSHPISVSMFTTRRSPQRRGFRRASPRS